MTFKIIWYFLLILNVACVALNMFFVVTEAELINLAIATMNVWAIFTLWKSRDSFL